MTLNIDKKKMVLIESMPVKSLITTPETGINLPKGERSVSVRGHAWAGDSTVSRVDLSIDFGATWIKADLAAPPNPYAWQRFSQTLRLPQEGYYEPDSMKLLAEEARAIVEAEAPLLEELAVSRLGERWDFRRMAAKATARALEGIAAAGCHLEEADGERVLWPSPEAASGTCSSV